MSAKRVFARAFAGRFVGVRNERKEFVEFVDESDDDDSDEGVVLASADVPVARGVAESMADVELRRDLGPTVASRRAQLSELIRRSNATVLISDVDREHAKRGDECAPGVMHQTQQVSWSTEQLLAIEHISTNSPMVAASMRALRELVMRDGIVFLRGNTELVPSSAFEEFIKQRLYPFVYQCIDTLLQIGIIPVAYELDALSGQRWPYVPAIGTYEIRVYRVRGATRYRFYWVDAAARHRSCASGNNFFFGGSGGGIEDLDVEVLHNFGYDLGSGGQLTSKCATALPIVTQVSRLRQARETADTLGAAPPLATEYNNAADEQQTRHLEKGAFVSTNSGGGDMSALANAYTRTTEQREHFSALLREYEQETGLDASTHFALPHSAYAEQLGGTAVVRPNDCAVGVDGGSVHAQWTNQFHLGQSRRLVSLPQSRAPQDYVSTVTMFDEQICAVFGVPISFIKGQSMRANSDIVHERLMQEVDSLKKTMSEVVTYVYNTLFVANDIERVVNNVERRAMRVSLALEHERIADEIEECSDAARLRALEKAYRRAAKRVGRDRIALDVEPLVSEEDLYVSEALKRVSVTLSKNSATNAEELRELFAFGAIDQKTFCMEMARRNNLDPTKVCQIDKELPKTQRQFLLPQFAEYHRFLQDRKRDSAEEPPMKRRAMEKDDETRGSERK